MEVHNMKHKSMKTRLLSLVTLLAILLPIIALSAAASSDKVDFHFAFNGNVETWSKKASKSDYADPNTNYLGSITIYSADFGQGAVLFHVEDTYGGTISNNVRVNSYGTYNMSYNDLSSLTDANHDVYLYGTPTALYVWGCSGKFQP